MLVLPRHEEVSHPLTQCSLSQWGRGRGLREPKGIIWITFFFVFIFEILCTQMIYKKNTNLETSKLCRFNHGIVIIVYSCWQCNAFRALKIIVAEICELLYWSFPKHRVVRVWNHHGRYYEKSGSKNSIGNGFFWHIGTFVGDKLKV